MEEEIDYSFGVTPLFIIIQISTFLVWLVLVVLAIRKAAKFTTGSATPLWILLVFLVPYLGAITTLACVKKPKPIT